MTFSSAVHKSSVNEVVDTFGSGDVVRKLADSAHYLSQTWNIKDVFESDYKMMTIITCYRHKTSSLRTGFALCDRLLLLHELNAFPLQELSKEEFPSALSSGSGKSIYVLELKAWVG
jgi:hypothetical protein